MNTLKYLKGQYNLNLNQPSPIDIVGVGRLDLLRWLRELDFTTGVEIGVEAGRYSELICQQNTQMKLHGVDPYLEYDEYREPYTQQGLNEIYEQMLNRMKDYIKHDNFEIIRKKSMDAVKDFEDESLDFVYIDANHEDNFPYNDIKEWAKKVRKGGIVSGHDYVRVKALNFTIKDALKKYTAEENINPWFILGSYQKKRGVVRDRTRSWMFIKE